jgi:predicted dehydrogenase
MEKGLDVLCEKPMAESIEDARRMHATAQRLNRVLMVHNQLRWYAPYYHARRLVQEGAIGDLHSLAMDMYVYSEAFFVGYRSRLPHAILQDLAIHHLDMIRYLTGQDGRTILVRDWKTTEDGAESPTTTSAFALLEMSANVKVSYRTTNRALLDPTGYLPRAVLTGTRGVLKITDAALTMQTFAGMKGSQPEETIRPEPAPRNAWGAFADSIRTREPSLTASGDNIKSLLLMLAAIRSAETGAVVNVATD